MTTLPGPPNHATGDRRKKTVVTYGRPTRNPTFSASSVKSFYDHPKTVASLSKLKRPTTNVAKKTKDVEDEFDIPLSDDEPTRAPPKPIQPLKTPTKTEPSAIGDQNGPDSTSPRKRKRTSSQTVQLLNMHPVAKARKAHQTQTEATKSASDLVQLRRSKRQAAVPVSATPAPPSRPLDHTSSRISKPAGAANTLACPLSPVAASPGSPADSVSSVSTTPKQKKLWHELLLSDSIDPEPLKRPSHTSASLARIRSHPRTTQVSGTHKARIVDRLKNKVDESTQDSYESSEDDAEKTEEEPSSHATDRLMDLTQPSRQETMQYSQSQTRLQTQQSSASQGVNKVTYARSRTYLQDSLEDMIFGDLPMVVPERPNAAARRTGAAQKAKAKSKAMLDDDSDENTSQGIRSIHELRAAGNKNRFLDDITRLLDDMKTQKPSSRSQRRSALMELAGKLPKDDTASRFIKYGFNTNIVDQLQYAGMDVIADILLCVILARLARSSASLIEGGALGFLARYLDETKEVGEIAREKRSNLSKVTQSDFIEYMESIRTCDDWGDCLPEQLSPCLIALMSIESLVVTHRRNKNSGAILSSEIASTLVSLATDPSPAAGNTSEIIMNRALSALEAATTLDVESACSDVWSSELLSRIASALPRLLSMPKPSQKLALHLCCSVTNDNEKNGRAFCDVRTLQLLTTRILEGFQSRGAPTEVDAACDDDLLVLALGLMINLTDLNDAARETASRAKEEGLAALVDIFVRGYGNAAESQSEEELQANITYCWLAIFLGTMSLNGKVRQQIRRRLPDQNESTLVEAVEQFARINQQADSQAAEETKTAWTGFTQKLVALVTRLQNGA